MAVGIVGVESDVGDDGELGVRFFDRFDGARNESVVVVGFFGVGGFECFLDFREKDDALNAERGGVTGGGYEAGDGVAGEAWEGRNGCVFRVFVEEERENEVVRGEGSFADEIANACGATVTAWADGKHIY